MAGCGGFPALSLLWGFPALAGLATLGAGRLSERLPRRLAAGSALALLVYSLWLWVPYSTGAGLWRMTESCGPAAFGVRYSLGLDGLSLVLVWLNAFLTAVALLSSWRHPYPAGYWGCFLLLEAAVMGVFLARDLFYFYVFWEAGLVPMFFLIGLWGGERRRHAALKFLLYTVFGGLFMLVGFLALVTRHHEATGTWTWSIAELARSPLPPGAAIWVFAAIAIGFAVKVPLWPLHHWLPDAHTEAPTAGSVILAGVLLKLGVYGFLRVLVPVFPDLAASGMTWLGAWAVFNILYGALCAMAQTDLKRLVAFTSVSHLGFCMLGTFSLTPQGLAGGSLQMVNHGLSTGALFLLVGMIYDRAHRRGVADFGGLAGRAPRLAFFFGLVLLSSIGLPGLNGFVGEALAVAGMAAVRPALAAAALGGVVLSAAYSLPAYQRVFWGPEGEGSASVADLDRGERGLLWVLCGLIVWIGLFPGPLLDILSPSVAELLR